MPTIIEDILKRFQHQGIVTRKEIMAKLGDQVKTTTAVKGLLENRKALFIKKGLYYLKSPDEWYRDYVEINPLLLAGRMHPKSVVGYHAALKCYGTAYSESNLFQVALDNSVRRVSKPFEFQNVRYQFYKADLSFGIVSSVLDKFKIKHFSRERLLLEGLMFPERFLGIGEFLQSIDGFTWLDLDDLLSMINHYPKTTIYMRLGGLLECNKKKWSVDEKILKKLEKKRPESRLMLVKNQTRNNYLVKRWSLMVPKTVNELSEA